MTRNDGFQHSTLGRLDCTVYTVPSAQRVMQDMGTSFEAPRTPRSQAALAAEQDFLQDLLLHHANQEAAESAQPAGVLCDHAASLAALRPPTQPKRVGVGAPPRVVSTGGPCGGKTTAQAHLQQQFGAQGYAVWTVPEAATLMGAMGTQLGRPRTPAQLLGLQSRLMMLQRALEDHAAEEARRSGRPALVLCDRGLADGKGYADPELWAQVLERAGITDEEIHARYDLVVHMTTAAVGAEAFYNLETNAHRHEDAQRAAALDAAMRAAWKGHPAHRVVDNDCTFAEKLDRVAAIVREVLATRQAESASA